MREITKHIFKEEAKIRGVFLNMSADMEQTLLRIILYCIVDDPTPVLRNFKNMTMGRKIKFAQDDLKKYQPDLYKTLEEDFKELWRINAIRGQIAHCNFIWDETDTSFLDILDIDLIEKEWRFIKIRYTRVQIVEEVEKYRKLILRMAHVCQFMIDDFNHKYPDFKKSSSS